MITNREIRDEELLEEALDEVVESARSNGVDPELVAGVLRERAEALASDA